MSAQVEPRLKPDPEPCACGCGAVGAARTKAWRDGLRHSRTCKCSRCMAPLYRRRAAQRERRIAKDLGGKRSPLSGAVNGADVVTAGVIEIEETANEAVIRGIRRWSESKTVSAKTARLFARYGNVPRALVLVWGNRKRLVVMRYEDFRSLVRMASTEPEEA